MNRREIFRWFGYVEKRKNVDIVKKTDEIGLEGNREKGSLKNKWMGVIGGRYEGMWSRWDREDKEKKNTSNCVGWKAIFPCKIKYI